MSQDLRAKTLVADPIAIALVLARTALADIASLSIDPEASLEDLRKTAIVAVSRAREALTALGDHSNWSAK